MAALAHSRFNIVVPLRHGRNLAYNSMSHATAVWDRAESDVFDRVGRGEDIDDAEATVTDLLYGGFIVRHGFDELALLRQRYDATRKDPSRMVLTIAPTLMCNFGCDYCFQGACKPAGTMSADVQDAIVDLVTRATPSLKRLHVAWYGGEPLLAPAVIDSLSERLIALCDAKSVAYDATIVTNGYKLTLGVARALAARRVTGAQITLDGARNEHDRRRFRLGGGGSFDRILANLKAAIDDVPLTISIRINIDSRNAASVYALLDELARQGFARRKNFGVYFAPVEAITEGCHNVADDCMSKSAYGRLETELTRYAFDAGLSSLPYPPRFRGVCGALRPKGFVVLPNGDVHKCWDTVASPDQKVGTIFDVDALAADKRALRWVQWSPFDNATCTSCKILPNCAGSCAHKFLNPDQTLGEAGALPCPSWKYNINERLLLTAERSGAITADDYQSEQVRTNSAAICSVSPLLVGQAAFDR
ncbi:MAG TPA: TIGR04463 family radical SAM/SPASM RiPP maturase [Stellaceae bacterium]|nr:TIGR04463 family radical SAM/SPASM RiPP maturase [Stellaceae bacterium]